MKLSRDTCGHVHTHLLQRVTVALLLLTFGFSGLAREYRIDSQATFDALCETEFRPGDAILFQRGERFRGMFAPHGSGTEGRPIRVAAFGQGPRPRIEAAGRQQAGLLLTNPSHWEVSGLEITNTDGTDRDQGALFGIRVLVQGQDGVYRHVYIDDCHIHGVNGLVGGKQRGGIHVHILDCQAARFDDLRITNNRIERVGGVGIGNASSCGRVEFRKYETVDHHLWTRVYVAGNDLDQTGRNSIIARASKNAVYENNTLAHSSRADTGHSIFGFNCNGLHIQHNEAYGNVGNEGHDRGGFDADYNCVNTFIQYNYSHDNEWFCGIMKRRNRNVVIRYNLSQNDRQGIYFYGFENAREATNIHVYNNTHFVRRGLHVRVFAAGRTPLNSRFENNIFYFEGQGDWGKSAQGINTSFRNNLYFHVTPHPSDPSPIMADPWFQNPGRSGTHIAWKTMDTLLGYRLRPGSPAVDAGLRIPDCGGRDLLGYPAPIRGTDVGSCEMQAPIPH